MATWAAMPEKQQKNVRLEAKLVSTDVLKDMDYSFEEEVSRSSCPLCLTVLTNYRTVLL
jgi:hypothetical protein